MVESVTSAHLFAFALVMPVQHLIPEHLPQNRERLGPAFTTAAVTQEDHVGLVRTSTFLNHFPADNSSVANEFHILLRKCCLKGNGVIVHE